MKNNEWVIRDAFSWPSMSGITMWFFRTISYSLNLSIRIDRTIYAESNEIYAPLSPAGCFVARSYSYLHRLSRQNYLGYSSWKCRPDNTEVQWRRRWCFQLSAQQEIYPIKLFSKNAFIIANKIANKMLSFVSVCGCTSKRPKRTKRYQCTESLLGFNLQ